jgi:hypothetical protein
MTYYKAQSGEWIQPLRRRGFKMGCCDCGLVHTVDFRVRDGKIQIRAERDSKATGGKRRHKGSLSSRVAR